MKVHGKFFWVNIILGIFLGVMTAGYIILGVMLYAAEKGIFRLRNLDRTWNTEDGSNEETEGSQAGYYQWYTRMIVVKIEAELLGDTYKGSTAEEGYQFYRLSIQIKNEGTMSGSGGQIYIYFEGTDYKEAEDFREEENRDVSELAYSNYEVIPAAQSGTVSRVIQVKNGITEVNMVYSDDVEKSGMCTVKLP